MVMNRRLQAEKAGSRLVFGVCPFRSHTVTNYTVPTGNLDEDTANEIIAIFSELAHEKNKCVIMVTHSKELAQKADVILTLKKGVIVGTEDIA